MLRGVIASIVTFSCLFAEFSHAALYEFTLEGEVTYSLFGLGGVQVGDPATIEYVADMADANPDPSIGVYTATGATIRFPTLTTQTVNASAPLYVGLNGTAVDTIQYLNVGPGESLSVFFRFPDETLPSDALPIALPMPTALESEFSVFQGTVDIYRGTITSYTSVEVPEPSALCLLVLPLMRTRWGARSTVRGDIRILCD